MRLKLNKGLIGIENIEFEWNQLFKKLSKPIYSQSVIWHKAYLNNLVNDVDKCHYFCIYKGSNLIAIFPFEEVRCKFYLLSFNTLSFSNHSHFGLNSIVVDENESIQYVFEFLYNALKKEKSILWDIIYLYRTIDNYQPAQCKIRNSRLLVQSPSVVCDTLPIQNYDKTNKRFSRNFKQNLKKYRNRILELENVEYKTIYKRENVDEYFNHFLDIEASGWKGALGMKSAIKLNESLRNFYSEIMYSFSEIEQMELNFLLINNKPIAAQFVIILEPTVFLFKIGYDEDYRRFSPGNLLIEKKLKEYQNNPNLVTLNLISNAEWHKNWKPDILVSNNLYNCKNLFVALCMRMILWLKDRAKEIDDKLKKGVVLAPPNRKNKKHNNRC